MTYSRKCSNCETIISNNYCPECGQKKTNSPLTLFSLIKNSFVVFVDIERSVFSLLYQILVNPKKIIQNYWNGFSRYYPGPSKVLLYAIAIVALHFQFLDSRILGLNLTFDDQIKGEYAFFCLMFPLLFFSSLLCFIRKKKPLAKHLSSFTYISSTLIIVFILIDGFIRIIFSHFYSGSSIVFFFFVFCVFFWQSRVFTNRSVKQLVFNVIVQFFIFVLLIVFIIFLLYILVPNAMKIN